MESPAVVPESDTALERYASALSAIEAAPHLSSALALDGLLARDALRAALAATPSEATPHMASNSCSRPITPIRPMSEASLGPFDDPFVAFDTTWTIGIDARLGTKQIGVFTQA